MHMSRSYSLVTSAESWNVVCQCFHSREHAILTCIGVRYQQQACCGMHECYVEDCQGRSLCALTLGKLCIVGRLGNIAMGGQAASGFVWYVLRIYSSWPPSMLLQQYERTEHLIYPTVVALKKRLRHMSAWRI